MAGRVGQGRDALAENHERFGTGVAPPPPPVYVLPPINRITHVQDRRKTESIGGRSGAEPQQHGRNNHPQRRTPSGQFHNAERTRR
jgi:hypothetical protein